MNVLREYLRGRSSLIWDTASNTGHLLQYLGHILKKSEIFVYLK